MSDIDVSDIVDCMSFDSLTLSRPDEAGEYNDDGLYGFSTESSIPILGSVQPATADDKKILPEGIRTSEAFMVWTTTPIYGDLDSPETVGDKVLDWEGKNWKIMAVTHWQHMGYYVGLMIGLTRRQTSA